ncbi:hypothetical protein SUDANB150_01412 [Streptomyces sp. enrichment culture]
MLHFPRFRCSEAREVEHTSIPMPDGKPVEAHFMGSPVGIVPTGLRRSACYHVSVTNWRDAPVPGGPDLRIRSLMDRRRRPRTVSYNLCHVVPSEGPRIRTGASSGPSKQYCRVFGGVSLPPQTLSRLTKSHTARGSRRLDAPAARLVGHCRRPRRSRLSTRAPDAAWPADRALARSSRRRAASSISTAASCPGFCSKACDAVPKDGTTCRGARCSLRSPSGEQVPSSEPGRAERTRPGSKHNSTAAA